MANEEIPVAGGIFMGLVSDPKSGTVTAGILNEALHEVAAQSFVIQPSPVSEYLVDTGDGLNFYQTPELDRVGEFIERHVPRGSSVHLLAEAEGLFSFEDEGDTPAAVFPADSIL